MTWPRPLRCASSMDGHRCQHFRGHPGRRHLHRNGPSTHSWGTDATKRQTFETTAPWITWTWQSTDRETRFTGRMRMRLTCCICGKHETVRIPIPRFGPVTPPPNGVHPERTRAIERHAHPGLQNPADWALPLRNPGAWPGGLPLSVFENVARTAVIEQQEDDDRG